MAVRRELRAVGSDRALGAVDTAGSPTFEGSAATVLASLRRRLGDERVAADVIANGWSNGYLYFAEATE